LRCYCGFFDGGDRGSVRAIADKINVVPSIYKALTQRVFRSARLSHRFRPVS
jgi:hypothetical protein